jgi:hypothetical protein
LSSRIAGPRLTWAEADGLVVLGDGAFPGPDFAASASVECGGAVGGGDVHHTIDHDGAGLIVADGELVGPLHLEIGDIGGGDFGEGRMAVAGEVAGVGEPVTGFLGGVADAFEGDLGEDGEAEQNQG